MKRRILPYILLLLAPAVIVGQQAYSQGGGAVLPKATKPKPTPTPKPKATAPKPNPSAGANVAAAPAEAKPTSLVRRPTVTPVVGFGQEIGGKLEPQSAGRIAAGNFYNEYTLSASAADLFLIQFQPDNPALTLQIHDQARNELPLTKDAMTGHYRLDTATGTLPADGEYKVRVLNAGAEKSAAGSYTLKFNRSGITAAAYDERLQKITESFKLADVDGTIKQTEQLIADDANQPGAYELLGVLYLYHRREPDKAIAQMEQAIKLNGAAVFRVTFDGRFRKPVRRGAGLEWEEPRTGWLRIGNNQLTLADDSPAQTPLATLDAASIGKVERPNVTPLFEITQTQPRKTYLFLPASRLPPETELILRMIRTYVTKKTK